MISARELVGVWQCPDGVEAGTTVWMEFDEGGNFISVGDSPEKRDDPYFRYPMHLRYTLETPTILRFRPYSGELSWTRDLEFDGRTLVITSPERRWACARPPEREIPDWFQGYLGPKEWPRIAEKMRAEGWSFGRIVNIKASGHRTHLFSAKRDGIEHHSRAKDLRVAFREMEALLGLRRESASG